MSTKAIDALEGCEAFLVALDLRSSKLYSEVTEALAELESTAASVERDAERYRWLRDTLQGAVGGGVEINDRKLVYEEPEPGEQVRVFWYPVTPVGFYESKGETLDAAIDAAIAAGEEKA